MSDVKKDVSIFDVVKQALSKTRLANIAAFILVVGLMYFGINTNDRDIIMQLGSAGLGYLFGVSISNGE